ncbi:hypothetical protein L6164_037531 [Bauhinia variegata]|uniref:Uncharacterized protein n=1 Tax=Bauhinia variegata TaxID=167791 RepID=A0ACB9KKM9_BAUVA|nr:hypothetical protein L6164_037531 [Bauhinia variegata]
MKIQCDVCGKEEASVFCSADEAALCHGCDLSIHHANKLAGKHTRFSLHRSTSKEIPLCDICQENRAFLFCQEDRAILCRECDIPIHRANELTQKHNRFLLTDVKLSGSSPNPASSSSGGTDVVTGGELRSSGSDIRTPRSISSENLCSPSMGNSMASAATCKVEDGMVSDTGSASTSSFSEYLIESIPGYCFEDLLDASFAPNGFCKNFEVEPKIQEQLLFPSEVLAAWFPQFQAQSSSASLTQIGSLVGVKETPKANAATGDWQWRYNGRTVSQLKKSGHSR